MVFDLLGKSIFILTPPKQNKINELEDNFLHEEYNQEWNELFSIKKFVNFAFFWQTKALSCQAIKREMFLQLFF